MRFERMPLTRLPAARRVVGRILLGKGADAGEPRVGRQRFLRARRLPRRGLPGRVPRFASRVTGGTARRGGTCRLGIGQGGRSAQRSRTCGVGPDPAAWGLAAWSPTR